MASWVTPLHMRVAGSHIGEWLAWATLIEEAQARSLNTTPQQSAESSSTGLFRADVQAPRCFAALSSAKITEREYGLPPELQ
eukprot:7756513-Alexandrium_andersonii.AAC.1